jgi:hypothetical protein
MSIVTDPSVLFSGDKDWGTNTRQVVWTNVPPASRRRGPEDITHRPRTLSGEAQQAEKPIEFWQLFFTDQMLDLIMEHTNQKISADIDDRRRLTGSDVFLNKSPHLKLVDKVKYYMVMPDEHIFYIFFFNNFI